MQGLDTDSTLKNLIYMYKGSQVCKKEAIDLKTCRATPSGQADPLRCEPKASNFLQCYHEMISSSKANCSNQYKSVHRCMQGNLNA